MLHPIGRYKVRRIVVVMTMLFVLIALAIPASAAIHEMVAAYCSGGGHGVIDADGFLEPPGISDFTEKNFAQPVISNGVVAEVGGLPIVQDHPAAKYPAGSIAFALPDPVHPSTHCNAITP
jgi:hypothetical protein